jgi:hypothetical protein
MAKKYWRSPRFWIATWLNFRAADRKIFAEQRLSESKSYRFITVKKNKRAA